jgi:hypothetical protein
LATPPKSLPPGVAHSRRAAMLMLAGLIAAGSPLPYTAVAVIPLIWAGVESVLAIRDRHAHRSPVSGIVSSVIGLVLVCILTGMVLLPYAFYGTMKNLQDCNLGANTALAAADCKARFGSVESIVGGFLSFG